MRIQMTTSWSGGVATTTTGMDGGGGINLALATSDDVWCAKAIVAEGDKISFEEAEDSSTSSSSSPPLTCEESTHGTTLQVTATSFSPSLSTLHVTGTLVEPRSVIKRRDILSDASEKLYKT